MEFLTLVDALHLVNRLGFYVKDLGLLDSALSRPSSEMFGVEAYPSIEMKAAALHQSLIKNHALVDGDKRTAWVLLNAFLELNGLELTMSTDEAFDFTLGVSQDRYDLGEAARLLSGYLRPLL